MQELFAYFEELDEAVYISEVETNELIFMNRCLREMLKCTEETSYKGKKCYNVLQGKDSPCNFCNNKELKVGTFTEWTRENTILAQRFIIRDTILLYQGRKYRVEVASEISKLGVESSTNYFSWREAILNECLQLFFSIADPEEAIDKLLSYLGKTFQGHRAYIFEIYENNKTNNTYEWCAQGVKPQIDILQNLSLSDVDYWVEIFSKGKSVEIINLEDIREEHPVTYSILKPQKITSLVARGIWDGPRLKGFIGIDNPKTNTVRFLSKILKELGGYMLTQFKRRDSYHRFNKMSYRDLLTGAYNHNAIIEQNMNASKWNSLGVVYCDINGLKETNDTQGHEVGNQLIQDCYHILEQSLNTEWIYRVGGDEFVALYCDTDEDRIKKDIDVLRLNIMHSTCQISVGYAWSDQHPIDTESVMNRADAMMYEEKEHYYKQLALSLTEHSSKEKVTPYFLMKKNATDYEVKLQRFLSNTYFDVSFLLTSLSGYDGMNHFFFGDMQKKLFFISENIREKFGFESNIVSNFMEQWVQRIEDPELVKRFKADLKAVLEKKQSYHDMRYQITDVYGNRMWIHCVGKIKWSDDGKVPLFFAGNITQQDEEFVVDTLTNFPTENVLMKQLTRVQEANLSCQAIGFVFHNITRINSNHGRSYGDELIREITTRLGYQLGSQMTFYRLSGMRCVALTIPHSEEETKELISKIKEITNEIYRKKGISLQYTCSFAVMNYPQYDVSPQDFVENLELLIKEAHNYPTELYVDNSTGSIQKLQEQSTLECQLLKDIINGMENFRIVVQPIVSSQDECLEGGEVLLRWRYKNEEISPAVFIPIIENTHMIDQVGRWIFEQAAHTCTRILSWIPNFYLTVNISLQQLYDRSFIDFIYQTLQKYDLKGSNIVMELTENSLDTQIEQVDEFITFCKKEDIRIALDDFGSGYSSLRVLLHYPSSIIKLDQSLLLEMGDSYEKIGFIMSIVYACHHFGKVVCMEGVETEFHNELAKEAGCDLIQGFYYYKPMETSEIYQLIAEEYDQEQHE